MRYLLHFAVFLLSFSSLLAQRSSHSGEGRAYLLNKGATTSKSMLVDTLLPGIFFDACADTLFTILADDGGYVAGTNDLLDREKAQYILLEELGTFQALGIVAYFAAADPEISGRSLQAKLYALDTESGGPGECLATSSPLSISAVQMNDTDFLPTVFSFPEPIASNDTEFFIAIDFSDVYEVSSGNIGLWSTRDGCGDGFDAWEQWEDGSWHALNEEVSWNLNLAFYMGLIITTDFTSSTTTIAGLEQWRLFPNPATTEAYCTFKLKTSLEGARLTLVNAQGQSVYQQLIPRLSAGQHQLPIPVGHLPAGLYTYQLQKPDEHLSGRLLVGR